MITPKRLLALVTKWLVISALVVLCALYIGDELSFQYRTHSSQSANAFGAVDMQRMLAIELKGGKVEYALDRTQPDQIEKCVHSLFPHGGLSPCWYLLRQSHQAIPLLIFPRFLPADLALTPSNAFLTPAKAVRYSSLTQRSGRGARYGDGRS